ncbi:MAG: glycosyltransferase family 87 protein [Terracidiphilus sp.]
MNQSPLRAVAAACICAVGLLFVAGVFAMSLTDKDVADRDFVQYWAAERQLVQGANPYDGAAILRIEQSVGLKRDEPFITFSPPVAFFFALPIGLMSAKTGLIVWLSTLFACLAASLGLLWRLHGCPDSLLYLFGFLFPPAVMCLKAGQIGIFMLLGVVLFLTFHKSRPFLAGAALLPCALKPHLFVPVAVVLILWEASRKSYRVLTGFVTTLLCSSGLVLLFDRHVWSHYAQMMSSERILHQFVPTLGAVMRMHVDADAGWLQFIPEIVCCGWAVWYFWTRRKVWNWMDQGLLLMIVAVACAPYAFFTDESIVLPAVLTGVMQAIHTRRSLLPIVAIAGAALIEVFRSVQIMSPYYLWTTPAWIAWYLYATRGKRLPADAAAAAD